MIRITLIWMFIGYLGITAWKDWYKSLCGLILLMGVYKHSDFPKSVLDIPGLNPWNLLLVMIVAAWLVNRRSDGCKWDMPSNVNTLSWLYFVVIVIGFFRMIWNLDGFENYARVTGWPMPSTAGIWNDYLFNTVKWVIPGILLFDGCRTDAQIKLALAAILGTYFILALQVIQYVPIYSLINSSNLGEKTVSILSKNVHYHRTDLAVMLAGSFWALFSAREIFRLRLWWFFLSTLGLLIFLVSLALTGGRAGYLAWAGMALVFCFFRYRKLLFLLPVVIIIALPYAPALIDRMTEGVSNDEGIDKATLTAGRDVAWPLVIDKIGDAPIIGHGREGMKQTGIAATIFLDFNDSAPHPHNAYLEALLDNGIVGFTIVIAFFFIVMKNSFTLFRDRESLRNRVLGGVCLALVGSQLIGSLTGQTFYPREQSFGMWCAIGLLLRMVVIRHKQIETNVKTIL